MKNQMQRVKRKKLVKWQRMKGFIVLVDTLVGRWLDVIMMIVPLLG